MARIKIDIQGTPLAHISIPVRITDINYGNHLGNDSLVSILHEARVAWLRSKGYTELDIAGVSLIQGDLAVEYTGECFYGDILDIKISSADISRASFDMYYDVSTNRNGQTIHIARAKTGILCFDYQARKVMALPDILRQLLTS